MMLTKMDAQSFNKEVIIGSSSHCLLGRDCITDEIFQFLV